jgi:hypothetical protein
MGKVTPATKAVTIAELQRKLEKSVALRDKAEVLMKKHGITAMLDAADDLKREVTDYCAAFEIERLELKDGRYGRLVTSVQERVWVGTKADLRADAPEYVMPLKSLVPSELWQKITKRIPDPEKIEKAIQQGLITPDEIAPCFYERMRAPFIRIFGTAHE